MHTSFTSDGLKKQGGCCIGQWVINTGAKGKMRWAAVKHCPKRDRHKHSGFNGNEGTEGEHSEEDESFFSAVTDKIWTLLRQGGEVSPPPFLFFFFFAVLDAAQVCRECRPSL